MPASIKAAFSDILIKQKNAARRERGGLCA
jgi:hypothetical protein